MNKKNLLILGCCVLALTASACRPKQELPEQPTIENPEQPAALMMDEVKALLAQNEEPEKLIALIKAGIKDADANQAEVMLTGLEQLQESHLAEYTDLLLAEEYQMQLMAVEKDLNLPEAYEAITDNELVSLLEKLKNSGYRFENFEGSWYPIVDYGSYRQYAAYLSDELKAYVELMAAESDRPSLKDAAIVIDLKDLGARLILAEDYIARYAGSPRIERVKDVYAGYLWSMLGGANNTPIYDWETKNIHQNVREAYEKFHRENPNLVSARAVKNWLGVLRDNDFVFNEDTLYQALDNIYGEALTDLGIEADFK